MQARPRVWPLVRTQGGPALALAVLVFAAALAGRAPIWLAAPLGLAVAVCGVALLAAGDRQRDGVADETIEAASPHMRAAALCGRVLLIVLVVAVVVNAAQGWFQSFPWFQLLLLALATYLIGLLWFRRRSR